MDAATIVQPKRRPIDGSIKPPGSKTLTIRAMLAAAMASGSSTLHGALRSDDTRSWQTSLEMLGAVFDHDTDTGCTRVEGVGGSIARGPVTVFVEDAGTAARFLTPILSLGVGKYRIDGNPVVRRLPMTPLIDCLRELGVDIEAPHQDGSLPIEIRAAGIVGGEVAPRAPFGSQFISSLLLAGPMMASGLRISLPEHTRKPYVDATVQVMSQFGVNVTFRDNCYGVPSSGSYAAADYYVEPDAVAAAFLMAAAGVTRGRLRIVGLGSASMQPEARFAQIVQAMGAEVHSLRDSTEIDCRNGLQGIEIDLSDTPDLLSAVICLAAAARTPSLVTGVGRVGTKERSRLEGLADGLRQTEAIATLHDDSIEISSASRRGATIAANGDQRLAMCFAVLGLAVPGMRIRGSNCVSKSYPEFFEVLRNL